MTTGRVLVYSFHVGSGCYDATAFSQAVAVARSVFDQATDIGYNMELLDIGGGFPGQKTAKISFEEVHTAAIVRYMYSLSLIELLKVQYAFLFFNP